MDLPRGATDGTGYSFTFRTVKGVLDVSPTISPEHANSGPSPNYSCRGCLRVSIRFKALKCPLDNSLSRPPECMGVWARGLVPMGTSMVFLSLPQTP